MVKKNIEEQFIDIIFALDDEESLRNSYPAISSYLEIAENEKKQSPYDYITKYVFENKLSNPDEAVYLFDYLRSYYLDEEGEDGDFIDTMLRSITRHIKLAIIQRNYIVEQTFEIERTNRTLKSNFSRQRIIAKELEEKINQFKDDKSAIYTDFISILGIFSALIFGLFGGFSTLAEFIQTISSGVSLSRATFLGSLLMIGLLSLIFLLLNGVALLTGKNFKSCCNNNENCNHPLRKKFPIYFYGLVVLSEILLVSMTVIILNNQGIIYLYPKTSAFIMFGVFFLSILSLYTLPKILDKIEKKTPSTD